MTAGILDKSITLAECRREAPSLAFLSKVDAFGEVFLDYVAVVPSCMKVVCSEEDVSCSPPLMVNESDFGSDRFRVAFLIWKPIDSLQVSMLVYVWARDGFFRNHAMGCTFGHVLISLPTVHSFPRGRCQARGAATSVSIPISVAAPPLFCPHLSHCTQLLHHSTAQSGQPRSHFNHIARATYHFADTAFNMTKGNSSTNSQSGSVGGGYTTNSSGTNSQVRL